MNFCEHSNSGNAQYFISYKLLFLTNNVKIQLITRHCGMKCSDLGMKMDFYSINVNQWEDKIRRINFQKSSKITSSTPIKSWPMWKFWWHRLNLNKFILSKLLILYNFFFRRSDNFSRAQNILAKIRLLSKLKTFSESLPILFRASTQLLTIFMDRSSEH